MDASAVERIVVCIRHVQEMADPCSAGWIVVSLDQGQETLDSCAVEQIVACIHCGQGTADPCAAGRIVVCLGHD